MPAHCAAVGGALLLALAAGTAVNPAAPVSVRVDINDCEEVDYEPLLCKTRNDCRCSFGEPNCSRCPDDGGSEDEYNAVCWCSGLPEGATPTGNECNPDKNYGPSEVKAEYVPIMCNSLEDCGCKWRDATPQCSRCPNDEGSATKFQNVCWCSNFWWDGEDYECNSNGDNGPFRVDNSGGGGSIGGTGSVNGPYNPIECSCSKQCGCSRGLAQCSLCPVDDSSEYQSKNVCWCDDALGTGSAARECNPGTLGGPYKIDVDEQGFTYTPIECDVNDSECVCELGTAKCGVCPFDKGSQWMGLDVCWCDFTGTVTEGFYPYEDNPSGECNPLKENGPKRRGNLVQYSSPQLRYE